MARQGDNNTKSFSIFNSSFSILGQGAQGPFSCPRMEKEELNMENGAGSALLRFRQPHFLGANTWVEAAFRCASRSVK